MPFSIKIFPPVHDEMGKRRKRPTNQYKSKKSFWYTKTYIEKKNSNLMEGIKKDVFHHAPAYHITNSFDYVRL